MKLKETMSSTLNSSESSSSSSRKLRHDTNIAGGVDGNLPNQGVRVIYNGQDVTSLIPNCPSISIKLRAEIGAPDVPSPPCPLYVIANQIEKALQGHKSFEEACMSSKENAS